MAKLPSGVFAETYAEDKALVRTPKQWASLALLVLFLAMGPILLGSHYVGIANGMLITAVAVMGLQITLGYAGQINLGQAALMGVGAFAAGVVAIRGAPFWIAIPVAGAAASAFGFIFGLSAVRVKGFYLALTTIAAQFIFNFVVLSLPTSWLGGPNGLQVPPIEILGLRVTDETALYYFNLAIAIVMFHGAIGIVRSRFGRAFVAVRDDDVVASMIGINVAATKGMAFLVGAFYAGIAGGLWAYYIRFISVDQFTLFNSIWFIGMMIVGGLGSIVGGLIGVFVVRGLQELITILGPQVLALFPTIGGSVIFASMNIVLGFLIAVFIIKEPKGLMYRWEILKNMFRTWPFRY